MGKTFSIVVEKMNLLMLYEGKNNKYCNNMQVFCKLFFRGSWIWLYKINVVFCLYDVLFGRSNALLGHRNVLFGLWNALFGLMKCLIWAVKCLIRAVKCQIWAVKCQIRVVKCQIRSVKCHFRVLFCALGGNLCVLRAQEWYICPKQCLWRAILDKLYNRWESIVL